MEQREPLTISVPEAGRDLGIGKNASYNAAHCGQIPVIKVGKKLRVPVAAFKKMLEEAGKGQPA